MKECAKFGITSVHDAGMGRRSLDAVRSIAKRDALLIRIYAMVDSGGYIDVLPEEGVDIFALWKKSGLIEDDLDGHLTVRAAKLFMCAFNCSFLGKEFGIHPLGMGHLAHVVLRLLCLTATILLTMESC